MQPSRLALFLLTGILLSDARPLPAAAGAPPPATSRPAPAALAEMRSAIPALLEEWHIPGMSIAVLRDGEVAWQGAFGRKRADREDPVNDTTVFAAASLAKPVFAYAVLKMHDEGLLDLDRPLLSCVPERLIETEFLGHSLDTTGFNREWFSRITARMALSHSSGIEGMGLSQPVRILHEPGSKFWYSSNGIEYLRHVVEHILHERVDSLVARYVFEPLGMSHSSMVWRDEYEASSAAGHDKYGQTTGTIARWERPTAQAALYTTAGDYGRFLAAVMRGEGLREETRRQMLTPQVAAGEGVAWGLGVGLEEGADGVHVWHWGDAGTHTSYFYGDVASGAGFVYFVNGYYGLAVLERIFALVAPGLHPALSLRVGDWSFADDYLSPAMAFQCKYLNGDVPGALAFFREVSTREPQGERFIDEGRYRRWIEDLARRDRLTDAAPLVELWLRAHHPAQAAACSSRAAGFHASPTADAARAYLESAAEASGKVWLAWLADAARARANPVALGEALRRSYTGRYDPYEITEADGDLFFGRAGVGSWRMLPLDDRTFRFEESDAFRIAMVIEDGAATGVKVVFQDGREQLIRKAEADPATRRE